MNILASLKQDSRPVVVYGVNLRLTAITLAALASGGIRLACLTDGRRELAGMDVAGTPVVTPERVFERYPNAHVFICPSNEFWSVYDFLRENGMTQLHDVLELTAGIDSESLPGCAATVELALETQRRMIANRTERSVVTQVSLILTERCTLNCRLCCNMMPLFSERKDYPALAVAAWAGKLAQAMDRLVNVVLMGGEPFLYRELDRLVANLDTFQNIGKLSLFTNGTVIPDDRTLAALRSAGRMHVIISDYGVLSSRRKELAGVLTENGISHDVKRFIGEWRDMGDGARRNRRLAENRRLFQTCTSKNCTVVLDGGFYRCARAAFGTRLGLIPAEETERVNLMDGDLSSSEIRDRVSALLFDRDNVTACDYCDGIGVESHTVKTAEQNRFSANTWRG